jgi:hypothetical protein
MAIHSFKLDQLFTLVVPEFVIFRHGSQVASRKALVKRRINDSKRQKQ